MLSQLRRSARARRIVVGATAVLVVAIAGALVVHGDEPRPHTSSLDPGRARYAGTYCPGPPYPARLADAETLPGKRVTGDFDGDRRRDSFLVYRPLRPAGWTRPCPRHRWRLRMRLGSGVIVDQLASDDYRYGGGSPIGSTVQQVVDLQGDGRDELLVFSSGNTARYLTVLSLVHGRIVAPRRNGRLAEFFFSGSTPPGSDPRQEPSGGGVNCEDVDGDGRRELTEYRPGGPGGRVLYRFAYRLDGSRLTRVAAHSTRGWPRFKVTSQGLDCAAPGRVADGHYAGEVIAVDRPGRRARFSVQCAPGEEQPPAPVTVDMSAARLHIDERGSRRPVSVGFERWARTATDANGAPIQWRITVRLHRALAVTPLRGAYLDRC